MSRDFLTTDDILEIHNVLVEQYGGTAGIRDMSGLEAAVFRPQNGYYANIVEEACALFESILINHPFVDGNKRTAFASCDVFLRINGYDCREMIKRSTSPSFLGLLFLLPNETQP